MKLLHYKLRPCIQNLVLVKYLYNGPLAVLCSYYSFMCCWVVLHLTHFKLKCKWAVKGSGLKNSLRSHREVLELSVLVYNVPSSVYLRNE